MSVQAHGKYPTDYVPVDGDIYVTGGVDDPLSLSKLNYYVSQLHEVDAFVGALYRAVMDLDEETVLVFYGDHLPSLAKDAALTLDGRSGILSSHLDFGQPGRGWDFRSPGHGQVNFEEIIRELNRIEYDGPLSVEWEDSGMDREYGAADAAKFVRKLDFPSSTIKFDAQMKNNR